MYNPTLPNTVIEASAAALIPVFGSYQTFLRQMQFCHWNVRGGDFYDLHEQFEELYTTGIEHIDAIAERLASFGNLAHSDPAKMQSELNEVHEEMNQNDMVALCLASLDTIITQLRNAVSALRDNADVTSAHKLEEQLSFLEEKRWMLGSFAA